MLPQKFIKIRSFALLLPLIAFALSGCNMNAGKTSVLGFLRGADRSLGPRPSPTVTPTPTPTPVPTVTPTATPNPGTPSPTATPKPATPTPTIAPTSTPVLADIPITGSNHGVTSAKVKGSTTAPFGYAEYLPYGYDNNNTAKRVPLIVFYVGMNELGAGTDATSILNNAKKNGPFKIIESGRDFPAVVLTPQYTEASAQQNCEFLTYAIAKYNIDPDRVYITGLSAGGYASSMTAYTCPEKLAAIVPIAVNIDVPWPVTVNSSYKKLATWGFHNRDDGTAWFFATPNWVMSVVNQNISNASITYPLDNNTKAYEATYDMVQNKMVWTNIPFDGANANLIYPPNSNGYEFHFTSYPCGGHDSWTKTYESKIMWNWMFNQHRKP